MRCPPVNERSYVQIEARFLDKTKTPFAPVSARYRIDCLTTCTVIKGWTAIASPASFEVLTITAEENRIIRQADKFEERQVIVEGTDTDTSEPFKEVFLYKVMNLKGVANG